jgi:hypothetical protein
MKYGNRSLWKRFFYSPVSIGIAIVVLYFLIKGGINIHEKAVLAENRYEQTKAELADLQQQKDSLSDSIDHLSTQSGMEAELREKYHAVKDGESVAVIIDNSSSSTDENNSSESGVATSTQDQSWWSKFLGHF